MFGLSIYNKRLRLHRPDYTEQRGGRFLLVWQDVPHWMVVDEDMKNFLYWLEQPDTFLEVLKKNPAFRPHRKQLIETVRDLSSRGILVNPNASAKAAQTGNSFDELPPIENIAWNLTHRCNLRCVYCYYSDSLNSYDADEISAAEVIDFLTTVKPWASKRATLTVLGGEPLLYPDKLFEVCRAARKLRLNPLVSTNGTLITDAFAREAKQIGLEVQVSLDGPCAAINDPLRGNRSFEKISKGIATLRKHDVQTILSMVCCRHNFDSLQAFLDLAIEWGVPEARFIPLKLMGGAKSGGMEMVPHYEIAVTAYKLLKEHPQYRTLLGRDCLSILTNTCRYSSRRASCGTGSQTLLLDADGSLYPCLNLNQSEFAFGNIRQKDFNFAQIWQNSEILGNVRACVSVHNMDRPCSKCLVRYWCLGGCRGETVVNTGDLKAPSIHCGDLRKTILEIFWMLAENPDIIKSYD
jgi:radical SAM protein with 4Fe4S-binding SPASM domain